MIYTKDLKMQLHTKTYLNFFGYDENEYIPCEMCQDKAVDIHHLIKRSKIGSKKERDFIENLVALCRDCHYSAETDTSFNMYCRIKHLENVCHQIYALIDINKKLKINEKYTSK